VTFEDVWARIEANAGRPFNLKGGKGFVYGVEAGCVLPPTNRRLPRSQFEQAWTGRRSSVGAGQREARGSRTRRAREGGTGRPNGRLHVERVDPAERPRGTEASIMYGQNRRGSPMGSRLALCWTPALSHMSTSCGRHAWSSGAHVAQRTPAATGAVAAFPDRHSFRMGGAVEIEVERRSTGDWMHAHHRMRDLDERLVRTLADGRSRDAPRTSLVSG
jgi:hypothetical protein